MKVITMDDKKEKDYKEAPSISYGDEDLLSPKEKEYAGLLSEKRALIESKKPSYRFKEKVRSGFRSGRSFKKDVLGLRAHIKGLGREVKQAKGYIREAKKYKKEIAMDLPKPRWMTEKRKSKKKKRVRKESIWD